MSERWRDTYDAWKTAAPDSYDDHVCSTCDSPLRYDTVTRYWSCERCDEVDADFLYEEWRDRQADEQAEALDWHNEPPLVDGE